MMRSFFAFALASLSVAAPALAQQPAANEVADKIVAVVGDSIVLKSDVQLEIEQLKASNPNVGDTLKLFKTILDRRVGELVLLQAALRDTSIHVTEEDTNAEIQKELDARRRQFGGEAQFQAALTQAGMSLEDLRRTIGQEVSGRTLLREYIQKVSRDRHPPPVTDEDIRKYFESNKASFGERPATITFMQIVIAPKASDSARASARTKAEEALKKLYEGADFETLAKQYSDDPSTRERGGDLGWFRSGSMVREFDQVVFSLHPGQYSNIVETSFGFHIIKLEKVRGAERQARHILIIPNVTAEDGERMRSYANEIAEQVRAGANFDSLAKAVGDPNEQSRVGPYPRERLPAPYNTTLTDAQTGAVIGPVELPGATGAAKFAIVKITDTRPAGEYSLDDPAFRNELREQLQQNTLVEELIRDLRKRTLVEYRIEQ